MGLIPQLKSKLKPEGDFQSSKPNFRKLLRQLLYGLQWYLFQPWFIRITAASISTNKVSHYFILPPGHSILKITNFIDT
jgi:hypothetical protein